MGSTNLDRLSNMPDEILSEILSLMPTKHAVRTSILSKKWRYNWTLVTSIDIDILPFRGVENFSTFVDRVLDLCKTTEIKLFRLSLSQYWVPKSSMTKWIDEAVRLNVRDLDIQSVLYEFPMSFLTCKTLTKLRIESDRSWVVLDWKTPFNLPCVKTLEVAVFSNPSLNAFRLIRGCPVLETLSIKIDNRSEEEEYRYEEYRFSIPTLKHMKLRKRKYHSYSPINKVVLNVPNLEDLFISGEWCSHFVMENFPSLVPVTLYGLRLRYDNLWSELLKGISGAKSLAFFYKPYYSGLPDTPFPNFPNLKHMEIIGDHFDLKPLIIFQFLESCSELEHLSIEIVRSRWFGEPEQSRWIEPHSVPSCMLKNLSTMKYEIFIGRIVDMQFLEYILGNAKVLRKLTITCRSEHAEDELWLCGKLLKCRRASRNCEIHFVGNSFDSAANC